MAGPDVTVLGATGLVGGGFLRAAAANTAVGKVYAPVRRALPFEAPAKVETIVDKDSNAWASKLPSSEIVLSALATTRSAAGGFDNQYKIDHDLNVELAKAAKAGGATTYVLVSSTGANVSSYLPYLRMKGEIERDIKAIGFDKTIILRPGILIGDRHGSFKGFGAGAAEKLGQLVYRSWFSRPFGSPIYGDEVAKVGVAKALSAPSGVHVVDANELLAEAAKL